MQYFWQPTAESVEFVGHISSPIVKMTIPGIASMMCLSIGTLLYMRVYCLDKMSDYALLGACHVPTNLPLLFTLLCNSSSCHLLRF